MKYQDFRVLNRRLPLGLRETRLLFGGDFITKPACVVLCLQVYKRTEADPAAHVGCQLLGDAKSQEEDASEPATAALLA